jgi:predicted DNA-binding protein (MmcQ/YjbR family)
MREHQDAPDDIVERLRALCLALPEAVEERAWVGTRWTVRKKNFAHVVPINNAWPPMYVKAVGSHGPLVVMTFRCDAIEHEALRSTGHPYFVPGWWNGIVGLVIEPGTDWLEVAELITESYRLLAPQKLRAQMK